MTEEYIQLLNEQLELEIPTNPLPTAYAINMERNEGFTRVLSKDLWERPLNAKEKVFDLFDLKWFYSGEMG